MIRFFNNIDTNNVDSKSHSCAYPITTKKEWNLVVLTIFSSLCHEERILSYMCGNGPPLKYRLYVFLVLTTS